MWQFIGAAWHMTATGEEPLSSFKRHGCKGIGLTLSLNAAKPLSHLLLNSFILLFYIQRRIAIFALTSEVSNSIHDKQPLKKSLLYLPDHNTVGLEESNLTLCSRKKTKVYWKLRLKNLIVFTFLSQYFLCG